jgi:hypothetical protein
MRGSRGGSPSELVASGLAIGKQSTPFDSADPCHKRAGPDFDREKAKLKSSLNLPGNPFSSQYYRKAAALTRSLNRQPSNITKGGGHTSVGRGRLFNPPSKVRILKAYAADK